GDRVVVPRPAILSVVRVLAALQLCVWLFALWLAALGVLCIAAVDLRVWLEASAAAGALHLAVVAALVLRKGVRLTSGAVAP
ncbi:MAG TPA: hypothetical protein VF516_36640, partial [Kofleriaceae bacterium]